MNSFFNSLYSQFLLRDLVAKVVPGFVGLTALASLASRPAISFLETLSDVHPLVTLGTLYGLSFIVGLLLQFLGQSVGLIHIHVWPSSSRAKTRIKSLNKALEFQMKAAAHKDGKLDPVLRQRERYAILKEMTGNFGMALLVLACVALIWAFKSHYFVKFAALCGVPLVIGVAAVLFRQNRFHCNEQLIWEKAFLRERIKTGESTT